MAKIYLQRRLYRMGSGLQMTDITLLVSDLQSDEGWRGYLYDDATGNKIVPGIRVQGHPTIAWGFALDVAPLTQAEALPILTSRAKTVANGLLSAFPWMASLSEPRQRAIANMAYNLGLHGEEQFVQFLGFMKAGQFDAAADDLEKTLWYKQVGDRGVRIVATIRSGT